jgi:hypothetical protein
MIDKQRNETPEYRACHSRNAVNPGAALPSSRGCAGAIGGGDADG